MTDQDMSPKYQRARNLAVVAVAGQAGCASLVIVITALFLGLWLDSQIGQRGPCTVGLLVLSAPLSVLVMLRIALTMIGKIADESQLNSSEEENNP